MARRLLRAGAGTVLVTGLLGAALLTSAAAAPAPSPTSSSHPPAPHPPPSPAQPSDPPGDDRPRVLLDARYAADAGGAVAGEPVEVAVQVAAGREGTVRLLAYSRPSTTLREVRRGSVTASGSRLTWTVRATSSTRLVAEGPGGTSEPVVLPVRPHVVLTQQPGPARCLSVLVRVFPAAAARTVVLTGALDGGAERVAYRRADDDGRATASFCGRRGWRTGTAYAELRYSSTWLPEAGQLLEVGR